jgi:phage terminase Nu1 subunit (DNA packaging protein)
MALLSMRQYAKLRGVSAESVSKAVKSGRISTTPDKSGKQRIDPVVADREWARRSDPSKMRATAPVVMPPEDLPDEEQSLDYFKEKAKSEHYKAKLSKLEFEEKSGKLVEAEKVQNQWVSVASIVRTKVLGIPSKARQRIPEITPDQYAMLEVIVRETLEDLADGDS